MLCVDICMTKFFGHAMTLDVFPRKLLTLGIAIVLLSWLQNRKNICHKKENLCGRT